MEDKRRLIELIKDSKSSCKLWSVSGMRSRSNIEAPSAVKESEISFICCKYLEMDWEPFKKDCTREWRWWMWASETHLNLCSSLIHSLRDVKTPTAKGMISSERVEFNQIKRFWSFSNHISNLGLRDQSGSRGQKHGSNPSTIPMSL